MESTVVINYAEGHIDRATNLGSNVIQRGKFVVIYDGNTLYAVFSALEQIEFHANIVEQFAQQHKIKGEYNRKRDYFMFHAAVWKVLGGGHWELNVQQNKLILHGRSIAYGAVDLRSVADAIVQSAEFGNVRAEIQG